jgi:hypothetical protein
MLPDHVLLNIFDFYVHERLEGPRSQEWRSLVHACRRWRHVTFGSPNRLNLQLDCTAKAPARDMLDIWLALPLVILVRDAPNLEECSDNIFAGLERSDRVRVIWAGWSAPIPSLHLEKISTAMQKPFPELTRLQLWSYGEVVLPDSFLGSICNPLT